MWKTHKTLNLAVQAAHLGKRFPDAHVDIKRSQLTWRGRVTPSPLSDTYLVRVTYKIGRRPDVKVLEPALESRDGEKPPHLFPGERLCLCLPGEWDGGMVMADTTIPWIAEWLLHYEIWLATGEWCGGGVHPSITPGRKAHNDSAAELKRRRRSRPWDAQHRPR
ncbi:MAG: hypothetical protein FJ276_11460 [Planctomycetes bacterium]|nr:hypothetical protein [Planctomycetota bacterium]